MPKIDPIDLAYRHHVEDAYRRAINGFVDGSNRLTSMQFAKVVMQAGRTPADAEKDIAAERKGQAIRSRPRSSRVVSSVPTAASYLAKRTAEPQPAARLSSSFGCRRRVGRHGATVR